MKEELEGKRVKEASEKTERDEKQKERKKDTKKGGGAKIREESNGHGVERIIGVCKGIWVPPGTVLT